MFLDHASIIAVGGKGGNGCIAWHREKYVDKGGPDGGDGGNGGSVVILADSNTDTLSFYLSRKRFKAQDGEKGGGKNCAGAGGEDFILPVPPGTMVFETLPDGTKNLLADLPQHGDKFVVCRGGRGGYGNTHFQTSVRQAPDFAELGEPGQKRSIDLQLKLVADVGIIGYPSVGKSSLITAVSRARPKIADYPFTTLVPNLGVVHISTREFVLCDIPGLIEGASEGKGLGYQFLRHIERCGILIHLLDVSRDDVVADYKAIRKELKAYSPTLAEKTEYVVLNKVDLVQNDAKPWLDALKKAKIKVFASVSAVTHYETDALMKKLLPLVLAEREKRALLPEEEEKNKKIPVLQPHLNSEKMGAFRLERKGDVIFVTGKRIEQFTAMTNFTSIGARQRFRDVADRSGLMKALDKIAKPDDAVFIGEKRVDEYLR